MNLNISISIIILSMLLVVLSSNQAYGEQKNNNKSDSIPDYEILKAHIFKEVGAQGYKVRTNSEGRIVSTTNATNYKIKNISYDKKSKIANVIVNSIDYTILIKQAWLYKNKDWILNNPDPGILR